MTSLAPRFLVDEGNDKPTVRPLGTLRDRPSDPDEPVLEVAPLAVSDLRDALRVARRPLARDTKPMPKRPPREDSPTQRSGVHPVPKTVRKAAIEEAAVLSQADPRLDRP